MGGARFAHSPCGSGDGIRGGILQRNTAEFIGFTMVREALVRLYKGKRFCAVSFFCADRALLPDNFGNASVKMERKTGWET